MSEIHASTHRHPEDGGWLRPAVFGAMDGLVSNFALIMGVFGGSAAVAGDVTPVILAGFAGLAAGAFSMAAGEYTSVASHAEFIDAQVNVERRQIRDHAGIEQAELAERFAALGIDGPTARRAAESIHSDPETALRVHSLTEFGVRPGGYPSPMVAAVSSFLSFALGAVVPLLPLLLGVTSVWPTVVASLVALFVCGAVVTAITSRHWFFGGVRQLVLGSVAAAITYGVGNLVGSGLA
ncbi:MAG TPA: VIT1/CCC1 transporter family protein [Aeromicrobium sp.]|jgi:VIT1/CCC1 family predicted Fe2+/Mn2+ transporter|nr:VIT1/CCC1 transporter family protein [Aeromicrobium sp.]HKY57718.1 VIT1/CCC1 transporter family protein [Aeromicrobium sp.]